MFYEVVSKLCKERKIPLTKLISDLGMSNGNVSKWKNGNVPKSSTLSKIAQYFNVSTDFLLGNTTQNASPKNINDEITTLFNLLTPTQKQEVISYCQFLISNR